MRNLILTWGMLIHKR